MHDFWHSFWMKLYTIFQMLPVSISNTTSFKNFKYNVLNLVLLLILPIFFLNQKKLIEELVLPLPHSKASLTVARQRGQLCSLSQERGWWTVDKHIFPKLVFALKSFDNICEKIQTFASKHGGIGCKRGGCNPVCKGRERNPAIYSMALSVASAYLADRTGAGLGSLLHRGSSAPLLATHLHKYIGSHHSESHLLTPSKAFASCLKVFSIAPFLADK